MENQTIIKNYKNKSLSPYNIQEIMENVYNNLDTLMTINPYLTYFAIKTIRKGINKEIVNRKEKKNYD